MKENEARGASGMVGCINGMRWQWKNCPKAYKGQYQGKEVVPTVILEAVVSKSTYLWPSYFGLPSSCNDLSVLCSRQLKGLQYMTIQARLLTLRQDRQCDHNTIIAYGAGNFDTASPGYPATPNKRLFYELKTRSGVRLVPEYRTCQRCSDCEYELGQLRVWRMKHCPNNYCLSIWRRDVNAAPNIRNIFLATICAGGERPVPFRQDPPRPQQ